MTPTPSPPTPPAAPSPPPPGAARPWRRWLWRGLLGTVAAVLLGVAGTLLWLVPQLPPLDPVTAYQPRQPLQVFTADGDEIAQFGSERRQFVPIAQTPLLLRQAVLAVEDWRFYEHRGIDFTGLARAVVSNLSGGMRQGASTITQQVARTFFLSHRFSPERKLKEAILALLIDQRLSKDQILELYMNQIFLGQRYYGFGAAADSYFSKTLDQLTLGEMALLAGLPQNPYYANPVSNLPRALARQRTVLARMQAVGAITAEQAEAARAETITLKPRTVAPTHAEYVGEIARRAVVERFGDEAYSRGLKVTTTVRTADQLAAWAAVRRGVLAYDARRPWRGPEDQEELPPQADGPELEQAALQALKSHRDDEQLRLGIVLAASPRAVDVLLASGERVRLAGDALRLWQPGLAARAPRALALGRGAVVRLLRDDARAPWTAAQWPEVEAALVALAPGSGRVRALIGGVDHDHQPFNHVTQAWRQPGSSFKPFLYSAALEAKMMPTTLVNDALLKFPNGWDPRNSDGSQSGPITLRRALTKSKNLVSIRVLQRLGIAEARDWGERFGFERARMPEDLTLALGSGGTTPMQLAQAYGVFANGGLRVNPVLIERIVDAQGQVVFQAPPEDAPPDEAMRVIPARNAFVLSTMLRDVTKYGTAAQAQKQLNRDDLYGKTGTTNDAVDAWFAGYQPGLVAVVWVGHDQPQSLGVRETGGGLALPIWIQYMQHALKDVPVAKLPEPPEGLVRWGGDWRYAELAQGGAVRALDVPESAQEADDAASETMEGGEGEVIERGAAPRSAALAPPAASGGAAPVGAGSSAPTGPAPVPAPRPSPLPPPAQAPAPTAVPAAPPRPLEPQAPAR